MGWADLARPAWAILAIAGAVGALCNVERANGARRKLLRVGAWGGATLLSVLYSQEQGLCALGAVLVAAALHPLFVRRERTLRRCLTLSAAGVGAYAGGFALSSLAWLAAYGVRGRAGLFLRTYTEETTLVAGGAWGQMPFPLHAESFRSIAGLAEGFDYVLAPAVYVVTGAGLLARLARGRWNNRATFVLAVELLGVTTFRVAMHRTDTYHLLSSTVPALMLLVGLSADFARYRPRLRLRGALLPVGVGVVASLIAATFSSTFVGSLLARADDIFLARDLPAAGLPYRHPGLDRAGDVFVPPGMADLALYIRQNTKPTDPIFCQIAPMIGPEVYFLADRTNPTRYDMLAELATFKMRREARSELDADPPKLVIGDNAGAGPEVEGALLAYKKVTVIDGVPILAR